MNKGPTQYFELPLSVIDKLYYWFMEVVCR